MGACGARQGRTGCDERDTQRPERAHWRYHTQAMTTLLFLFAALLAQAAPSNKIDIVSVTGLPERNVAEQLDRDERDRSRCEHRQRAAREGHSVGAARREERVHADWRVGVQPAGAPRSHGRAQRPLYQGHSAEPAERHVGDDGSAYVRCTKMSYSMADCGLAPEPPLNPQSAIRNPRSAIGGGTMKRVCALLLGSLAISAPALAAGPRPPLPFPPSPKTSRRSCTTNASRATARARWRR